MQKDDGEKTIQNTNVFTSIKNGSDRGCGNPFLLIWYSILILTAIWLLPSIPAVAKRLEQVHNGINCSRRIAANYK